MKRPRFMAKNAFFLHATFITANVVGKGGDSGVGKPDPSSTSAAAALGVTFAMATPRNRGVKQQKVS